jgi:hypothetical protein
MQSISRAVQYVARIRPRRFVKAILRDKTTCGVADDYNTRSTGTSTKGRTSSTARRAAATAARIRSTGNASATPGRRSRSTTDTARTAGRTIVRAATTTAAIPQRRASDVVGNACTAVAAVAPARLLTGCTGATATAAAVLVVAIAAVIALAGRAGTAVSVATGATARSAVQSVVITFARTTAAASRCQRRESGIATGTPVDCTGTCAADIADHDVVNARRYREACA